MSEETEREPFPGQIYMDSMHFGMGASCLQITYEAQNINHARFLYDMFLPWTPIMSALSATSPLLKGQISDHDFRWEVIEGPQQMLDYTCVNTFTFWYYIQKRCFLK